MPKHTLKNRRRGSRKTRTSKQSKRSRRHERKQRITRFQLGGAEGNTVEGDAVEGDTDGEPASAVVNEWDINWPNEIPETDNKILTIVETGTITGRRLTKPIFGFSWIKAQDGSSTCTLVSEKGGYYDINNSVNAYKNVIAHLIKNVPQSIVNLFDLAALHGGISSMKIVFIFNHEGKLIIMKLQRSGNKIVHFRKLSLDLSSENIDFQTFKKAFKEAGISISDRKTSKEGFASFIQLAKTRVSDFFKRKPTTPTTPTTPTGEVKQ